MSISKDLGIVFSGTGAGGTHQLLNGQFVLGKIFGGLSSEDSASYHVHLEMAGGLVGGTVVVRVRSQYDGPPGGAADPSFGPASVVSFGNADGQLVGEHTYADPGSDHKVDDVLDLSGLRNRGLVWIEVEANQVAGALTSADIAKIALRTKPTPSVG